MGKEIFFDGELTNMTRHLRKPKGRWCLLTEVSEAKFGATTHRSVTHVFVILGTGVNGDPSILHNRRLHVVAASNL